jgi:rhamnosyltransferase
VISVVIPVKDGGGTFQRCLERIAAQEVAGGVEVVVVDSGSRDGSVEAARAAGAVVVEIPPEEFGHGSARNLGARTAHGDPLVFLTQDAYPADERWLASLTAPLASDERLAGVYGRQLAAADAQPPERYFLDFLYGPEPRLQGASGAHEISMENALFSNVNSAIRRSAWEELGFAEDVVMAEDGDWARRVLLAGRLLRYEPAAAVVHSHRYGLRTAFRRFFDSGAASERNYMAGSETSSRVLRRRALEYARGELGWLVRNGHALWIPYAGLYELTKFAGLQVGVRHERLPAGLKRRLSGYPEWWS